MPVGGERGTVAHQRRPRARAVCTARMKRSGTMDFWSGVGSIFWFMILFASIMLPFRIFGVLFSRHEMSGWGKATWTLFLFVFPWFRVLVYLIARGRSMN